MKNLIKTFESFNLHSEDEGFDHEGMIDHDDHHEAENYMFFGNLETIHRLVGEMLQMDPREVDQILKNGHNWAVDHIATSKDDIEEVAGFLINEMSEPSRAEHGHAMEVDEEFEEEMHDKYDYEDSEDDLYGMYESYICEACGSAYEGEEVNEDTACNECGGKVIRMEESGGW